MNTPMKKWNRTEAWAGIILLLGFLMRLGYVLYTPYLMGQHDLMELGSGQGHLGYIEYFLEGGSLFPDFNPMYRYQFYHPPLSHLLSAAFVRCNLLLGVAYERAFENLQFLSLFYSAVTLFFCYGIFRELKLDGKALLAACMLTAFHPGLYLMAGSINNDGLCLMFMAGAVLYTLRWYGAQSLKEILLVAVCVLGGVWTKANAFLLAPAIAFVFVCVLVKNRKDPAALKRLVGQMVLFGILTVPLGMTWSIYNYVKFGMPFDFTPAALTTASGQYVGDYSIWQRFFGVKGGPFLQLHVLFRGDYKDYNVIITLLKTSVFGEYLLVDRGLEYGLMLVLTLVNGLLAALLTAALCVFAGKRGSQRTKRCFLLLLYVVLMVMYVRFCFQYAKVCSMDFRYIALTVPLGAAALGWRMKVREESRSARLLFGLVIFWSLLSVASFLGLGMTPRVICG